MVHIAPLPPWRRRVQRITGILLAALGVVVLVVAIIALRQPNGHQAALHTSAVAESSAVSSVTTTAHASSSAPTTPASTTAAPTTVATTVATTAATTLKSIPIVVLNNTEKAGLALTAADRFKAGGWTVTSTGNISNNILSTCAYYDPKATNAEAAASALRVQFPAIKRIAPKFSGLPAGPIVVVLTTDYS